MGLLAPIERATRDICANTSTASVVIPMVRAIKMALTQCTDNVGIQTMKAELLDDVNKRVADVASEPFYAVSTLVDPQYRGKLFLPDQLTTVTDLLVEEASRVQLQPTLPSSDVASEATQSQTGTEQPAAKRARLDISPLELLAAELGASAASETVSSQTAANEVRQYLSLTNVPLQHCPLAWWKEHCGQYPRIAKVAQRYLSAPPTSVASERLFSTAGNLYSDQRSQLAPERAEMLLFIRENFKYLE